MNIEGEKGLTGAQGGQARLPPHVPNLHKKEKVSQIMANIKQKKTYLLQIFLKYLDNACSTA